MPRKTAKYKLSGGPLKGRITNGYAHTGSYNFVLWGSDNSVIAQKSGSFLPGDSCIIELPGNNEENNGRLLECISAVTILPPVNDYNITLALFQDGVQLVEADIDSGTSQGSIVNSDLFIQLIGE